MIHPILRLAAAQPMLLAAHAGAYAGLMSQALRLGGSALERRLLWHLACALCLVVAAVLAGVATLLWAVLPMAGAPAPWLLVLTPLLPAVLGLWAGWRARTINPPDPFAPLQSQLAQDAALLVHHSAD